MLTVKHVVILGSTGSIGRSALRVVESCPGRLQVCGLAVQGDADGVLEQAVRYGVRDVAVADPVQAARAAAAAPEGVRVHAGPEGVTALAALAEADVVLCAVVGTAGLRPVLTALEAGKDVALATKEVLVAAGALVTEAARASGGRLLPVDSEHSAIFQCLGPASAGLYRTEGVRRLILTASGGPFAGRPELDLSRVTLAEALAHPRWSMGPKISIDSATLMNKGLEVIEGHWLFGVPMDRIEVVIHPESIVHSMVEFADGSVLAQMSPPDMRYAIQYALLFPERVDSGLPSLDLVAMGGLSFRKPDEARFPCLGLARRAAAGGGTLPAVLNAANEVAVEKFLEKRIPFDGVWRVVERVMDRHSPVGAPDLEQILAADAWARREAAAVM
jgi:1-deoxy-D-xylulose-5-phosphate reductoisomerase